MLGFLAALMELLVAPPVLPVSVPNLEHPNALCAFRARTVPPAVRRLALHVRLGQIPLPVRPLATTVVRVHMSIVAELARIVWLALIPIVQDNWPVLHVREDLSQLLVRQAARSARKVNTASLVRQRVQPAHPGRHQRPAPPFASLRPFRLFQRSPPCLVWLRLTPTR